MYRWTSIQQGRVTVAQHFSSGMLGFAKLTDNASLVQGKYGITLHSYSLVHVQIHLIRLRLE